MIGSCGLISRAIISKKAKPQTPELASAPPPCPPPYSTSLSYRRNHAEAAPEKQQGGLGHPAWLAQLGPGGRAWLRAPWPDAAQHRAVLGGYRGSDSDTEGYLPPQGIQDSFLEGDTRLPRSQRWQYKTCNIAPSTGNQKEGLYLPSCWIACLFSSSGDIFILLF